MKTLSELYKIHSGKVTDKWPLYLREYDRLFSPYREQPISMLEIGVQNGGSLEIWSKYFPNAVKLVGCDINSECARLNYDDPRIKIVVGDAASSETKDKVLQQSPSFDLIIEDGSHDSGDIIKAFLHYFSALNNGGLYVAEDLHCSYWQEYSGGLFHPYSSISFFKCLAEIVNYEHWGVNRSRVDLLAGFKQEYNLELDESLLAHVSSIEIINSICIVRKNVQINNTLGMRIISGRDSSIEKRIENFEGKKLIPIPQDSNIWSDFKRNPTELFQMLSNEIKTTRYSLEKERFAKELLKTRMEAKQEEIVNLYKRIAAIENSRSWRYTSVLRTVGRSRRAAIRVLYRIKNAALNNGGFYRLGIKTLILFRNEGWSSIIKQLLGAELRVPVITSEGQMVDRNDYQSWIKLYDTLNSQNFEYIQREIESFDNPPKISVIMPVYRVQLAFLRQAIDSVLAQLYPHWELCIADDASGDSGIRELLINYANSDSRIKVVFREKNGHISAASNSALELASGDYIALLDNDDLLPVDALYLVAKAIALNPDVALIYSDEDKINAAGDRYSPYFKSGLNYELLLAQNMICHLGVYKRSVVNRIGGFRIGFEGAQDYDLALRTLEVIKSEQVVHIPRVLYHWRAISGSTALCSREKRYASEAARKAISEHLIRVGRGGVVMPAPDVSDLSRIRYSLPESLPKVSILIPTRDRADLLKMCLESVLKKTDYPNYEIIVIDNGSIEIKTQELLDAQPKNRVRVIRDDSPFNYSRLNNLAARQAHGDILCLMNNDIEIINSDWMEEMVSFAHQKDIGCVGARLWYPNGGIQHAGVILGIGGVAGHAHKYLTRKQGGYFSRALLHQEFSAVTGACLMIRKSVWDEVDGLDESFAVAFNDVDFCLRVRSAGYRNVWTPYAEMNHHESASRGAENNPEKISRFQQEIIKMQTRWGEQLLNDPFYNPNLTLVHEDFSLAWPRRCPPLEGFVDELSVRYPSAGS